MTVADVLKPERVVFLSEKAGYSDALKTLAARLATFPDMPDVPTLEGAFLARESMMSTGIGMGIGVPHVRLAGLRRLVMAVGIHKKGLADYPALDRQPVHVVAMIAAGEGQHAEYIRMLANVVAVLKRPEARQAILAAESEQAVYDLLCARV